MAISKRQAALYEQKGQEGEKIVGEAIEKAIENLQQEREDMCFSIYDNYVFKTKSVFGLWGTRYTEIDKIVVTNRNIFIFEVKLQEIGDEQSSVAVCKLKNGTKVANPVEQNHTHKIVLAELLGLDLHNIITVECLLGNILENIEYTEYVNDYLLEDENELVQNIQYILESDNCVIDYEKINQTLVISRYKYKDGKEKVKNSIERWKNINRVLHRDFKYYPFKITDMVMCPLCQKELVFSHKPIKYVEEGNKYKTDHYHLFCVDYENCKYHVKLKKDKIEDVSIVDMQVISRNVVSIHSRCSGIWLNAVEKKIKTKYELLKLEADSVKEDKWIIKNNNTEYCEDYSAHKLEPENLIEEEHCTENEFCYPPETEMDLSFFQVNGENQCIEEHIYLEEECENKVGSLLKKVQQLFKRLLK